MQKVKYLFVVGTYCLLLVDKSDNFVAKLAGEAVVAKTKDIISLSPFWPRLKTVFL